MVTARMRNQRLPNRSLCSDGSAGRAARKKDSSDQQTHKSCTIRDVWAEKCKETSHKPASAPRGRPTLCEVSSPSERSFCNHRFVVDSGKPCVVATFLLPMPFVRRQGPFPTQNAYKHLGFESNVAVFHGMCHESVLCVDVKCAKTCCFITHFMAGACSIKRSPKQT